MCVRTPLLPIRSDSTQFLPIVLGLILVCRASYQTRRDRQQMSNVYCNAATTSGTTNDFLQNKYIQKVDATGMMSETMNTVRTTLEKKQQNNKIDGNQASKQ